MIFAQKYFFLNSVFNSIKWIFALLPVQECRSTFWHSVQVFQACFTSLISSCSFQSAFTEVLFGVGKFTKSFGVSLNLQFEIDFKGVSPSKYYFWVLLNLKENLQFEKCLLTLESQSNFACNPLLCEVNQFFQMLLSWFTMLFHPQLK